MLARVRDAASLAISVIRARNLMRQSKNGNSADVITGFGYALMDIFDSQFVDMDSIVKKMDQIEEVRVFLLPLPERGELRVSQM